MAAPLNNMTATALVDVMPTLVAATVIKLIPTVPRAASIIKYWYWWRHYVWFGTMPTVLT